MATALARPGLLDALGATGDRESLLTDEGELAFYGGDVFRHGHAPVAVFRPASVDALSAGVTAATSRGVPVIPRGGGMSYTGGYLAPEAGALLVDVGRLDRVVAIDPENMTVTVEAGCTWAALRAALKPHGLRTPFWGTLSGAKATVGGGMSQNGVFWGTGLHGSAVESALKFDVVLADGRVLSTGNGFFRPFGPDLTGLFAADTGALGIKARVTLRLQPDPAHTATASWSFPDADAAMRALATIARAGLASELFGFDPFLQNQRMKRDSLAADAAALGRAMRAQGSFLKGLKAGAQVALAGRSFLPETGTSLHLIAEGRHEAAVRADRDEADRIARAQGGRAVPDTIPTVLRANPFPPVNSMLGPEGERWVPVHALFRHSRAPRAWAELQALIAREKPACDAAGVGIGAMFVGVGAGVTLIEPVFFWPGPRHAIHERSVEPQHLARLPRHEHSPAAQGLVERLREEMIELFGRYDAAHLQIARTYPLRHRHDPAAWGLLRAVKAAVDPHGLMNPGSLGL